MQGNDMIATTPTTISAQEAVVIAQDFVSDYLTDLMGAGTPWRMRSPLGGIWVVPIWLAYPGFAEHMTVGSVAVDEVTGLIVSWTPITEILSEAERFHTERQSEIERSFQIFIADNT